MVMYENICFCKSAGIFNKQLILMSRFCLQLQTLAFSIGAPCNNIRGNFDACATVTLKKCNRNTMLVKPNTDPSVSRALFIKFNTNTVTWCYHTLTLGLRWFHGTYTNFSV